MALYLNLQPFPNCCGATFVSEIIDAQVTEADLARVTGGRSGAIFCCSRLKDQKAVGPLLEKAGFKRLTERSAGGYYLWVRFYKEVVDEK